MKNIGWTGVSVDGGGGGEGVPLPSLHARQFDALLIPLIDRLASVIL